MHASSIVNYHYYGHHHPHQTSNISGANCQLGTGPAADDEQLRTLVTPNQATDLDSDENDSENATRNHFQAAPIATNHPDQDIQTNESMLAQLMPDDGQKVHFVENRLACGQIAYESYENSQEHYRYQATATAYHQEEEEAHYYEQQQQQYQAPGKQQEHIGAEVPADQTTFHHQPAPEPHLVLETNRHQAVDLSSEQSAHGPFQAPNQSPVYYDLTSASIPEPKTSSSSNAVTLHYHAHHLHQNPISHQHEQDGPLELQRSANFFYHQPADHYDGTESQRYLAEFVPVSSEQNRFARTLDWHEGLQEAVEPEQQAIDCHQLAPYSYEPSGGGGGGGGGVALGPAYSQTHLSALPNTSGDFQPTTNENYHHTYQPMTGHIQEHPNDCQGKQINLSMCKHQPSYETQHHNHHLMEQATCSSGPPRDSPSRALSTLSESLSMTTNSDMESIDSALTRDEKKAREANIPLSYHEIVNLSIDQFNEQLLRYPYTEAQLTLMKDIRRRGKNKVAAQTCRKRKMEQITELQQEVAELANKRVLLALERSRLNQEHAKLVEEYNRWCRASGTEFV